MLNKYTLLLISIIIYSNNFTFGQENYLITGKINTSNPEQSLSIPIVLMEIKMEGNPSIKPIQKTTSDSSGNFKFTLQASPAGTFYRISTIIKGQLIGSNPVKFEKKSRKINLVLELPDNIEGLGKLFFDKNVLIFELWENFVRVTDIVIVENRGVATIDASKSPFKRQLPPSAKNINIINPPPGAEIKQVDNEIQYKLTLPPGRHQLYMTYDLPTSTGSINMVNTLPPTVGKMEIIVPKNSIQANFDPMYSQISRQDKNFDNQVFISQSIDIGQETSSVEVILTKIPLAQKKLFYPAIILLILLISGLFWYLKNNLSSHHRQ